MTKNSVLEIFTATNQFMTPDEVAIRLRGCPYRSSVYSYLFRLHKQGLLMRKRVYGRIVYGISQRGIERLQFLRVKAQSQNRKTGGGVFSLLR